MKKGSIVTLDDPGKLKQPEIQYPEFAVITAQLPESTYQSFVLDRNLYGYSIWDARMLKEVGFYSDKKTGE
jgi:hypothetical protein